MQHYSFDLWLTLIKSNPDHKRQRATYFYQHWNPQNKPVEAVEGLVFGVDRWGNHYNEITGHCLNHGFMFGMVLQQMGVPHREITAEVLQEVKTQVAQVFSNYPPSLIDDNLPKKFHSLRDAGCTLNLSSNTGFANGRQLRPILEELGIGSYFNFFVFSDEIHYSKPDQRFFEVVWRGIEELYPQGIRKDQVLHVGDNPFADVTGAENFGFNTLLLTDPERLSAQI